MKSLILLNLFAKVEVEYSFIVSKEYLDQLVYV